MFIDEAVVVVVVTVIAAVAVAAFVSGVVGVVVVGVGVEGDNNDATCVQLFSRMRTAVSAAIKKAVVK